MRGITMFMKSLKQKFIKLSKNKAGNFAMIGAIAAPLLLAGGGLAMDLANQTALKTRFQAASDSVSLAVATRIANGDLTIADAESFGESLLSAQMANDSTRFSNLKIVPLVKITEVINGGVSTWDVQVGGTATQDTTTLAIFLGKETTSATVASTAQSGQEEVQGALSMAVIIDVSGSMGWELNSSSSSSASSTDILASFIIADLQSDLGITYNQTVKTIGKFEELIDPDGDYALEFEDIMWVIDNYTPNNCSNITNSTKNILLNGVGASTSNSKSYAKQICNKATWSKKKGASTDDLLAYISSATPAPMTKMEALQDAAAALFAQFDTADPTSTYVRTGLTAYSSYVRGDTNMEWGSGSAAAYVKSAYASGGTASTNSFKWSYDQLKSSNTTEPSAHASKNGQTPERFILFMTDGDNNNTSDDTSTKNYCDSAKNDGITVYSVAFAAPSRGEALLNYCASSSDHFYDPDTAAELVAAFKKIGLSTSKTLTRLTH